MLQNQSVSMASWLNHRRYHKWHDDGNREWEWKWERERKSCCSASLLSTIHNRTLHSASAWHIDTEVPRHQRHSTHTHTQWRTSDSTISLSISLPPSLSSSLFLPLSFSHSHSIEPVDNCLRRLSHCKTAMYHSSRKCRLIPYENSIQVE